MLYSFDSNLGHCVPNGYHYCNELNYKENHKNEYLPTTVLTYEIIHKIGTHTLD